jgi:iron complex transport system substrate-binding protein
MKVNFPQRIVCMTEESVETIYALGLEDRIVGVSSYVKRPEAATKKPKVSVFTHAQLQKIVDLRPDLVLGFSDIQKDIAKDLIGMGLNVWIANHRTIEEILSYILTLSSMLGVQEKGVEFVGQLQMKIQTAQEKGKKLKFRPRVFIEEWDEPTICGINWFSEVVELCGGVDVFKEKSQQSLGKDRIIRHSDIIEANPDIMLACWCGKKVDKDSIYSREGFSNLSFIKNKQVFELEPEVFLQPGPAPFVSGIEVLEEIFASWQKLAQYD